MILLKLKKKNGTLVEFDGEKIIIAIRKSAERAMVKLTEYEESYVVNEVYSKCKKEIEPIPISEVHKMVEQALRIIVPVVGEA